MASFEEQVEAACEAGDLPGVVLVASGTKGDFSYQKAFGPKSLTEAMDINATFILASCTKLMTSIAALQCVERGQVGLDDDLGEVVPELKDPDIITGFKEGTEEPILVKAKNKITLRQLLTHTSGFALERGSPLLSRWRKGRGDGNANGSKAGMTLLQFAQKPLLFEPGTSWFYGASTDWVGILVMRLNDMSLEAYMQKHIWDPLGIENITFHQELKPDVKKNLVTLAMRGEQGIYVMAKKTDEKVRWIYDKLYDDPVKEEFGSGGAIASAVEFMKIMDSIARDDGKLLTSESIDEMFTSQIEGAAQEKFELVNKFLARGGGFTSRPPGTVLKHGLAGMLVMSETDTGVKVGTLSWSGIANLLWTIDRASGLSLFYASNIMPYGDFKSHEFQQLFEKEMYKRYAESQAS